MKSWIFFPSEVIIEVSYDGKEFQPAGTVKSEGLAEKDQPVEHRDFTIKTDKDQSIQKVRFTVKNFGKCPQWHLGAGNDTWLFLDELIVK